MTPRDRIADWFANEFKRGQFRLSMGEIEMHTAGMNSVLVFLAQGIAETSYGDEIYLIRLMKLHDKLTAMIDDLQKIPGHEVSGHYYWCLTSGCLIEYALQAVAFLRKEDRDG